jgi:hypothetical protein
VSVRSLAVALAFLAASCSRPVPELSGYEPVDVAVREVARFAEGDSEIQRRTRVVITLRGPATIADFVRDDNVLYAELRWRGGPWIGTATVTPRRADGANAGVATYEASCVLDHDPRITTNEAAFRAALADGGELEARLVVGRGAHIDARSRWVNLARHQDALRRELR